MSGVRRAAVVIGVICGPPLLFAVWFTAHYGYSPLVVALHVVQVAAAALLLSLAGRVLFLAITPGLPTRSARLVVLLVGGAAVVFYFLVIALSTVTNEAWGWSISIDLARAFVPHLAAIVGNLPVWRGWIVVGALAFDAVAGLLLWALWHASPRIVAGLRSPNVRVGPLLAMAVISLVFIVAARRSPSAGAEPFTALFTAPGQLNVAEARARNVLARRAYADTTAFTHRNVILILSDALRADRMGVYSYARQTTPFLSGLAAAGRLRKVDLAMATCPFTACGVMSTLASRDSAVLDLGALTLQDVLHDRGYRVNMIMSGDHTAWASLRMYYGTNVDFFFDGFHFTHHQLSDDRGIFEGLDSIGNAGGRPAFFYFFLTSTHTTGLKLPEFRRWTPAEIGVGTGLGVPQRNAYDNGVLQADNTIRGIFAELDRKGYLANSIVMILGDHGDGLGEHGFFGHTKYVYQEALHIPLLIVDDPAARYANLAFATQSDVAPTILDRLGLSRPQEWQGQSFFSQPAKTFSTHWTERGRPWHAVVYRDGSKIYKYSYVTKWGARNEELYELTSDPAESTNLISRTDLGRVRELVRARAAARWAQDIR
jgi:glucan phosphoethanolaminetransferase (alkaline phosphatase superfamily)